MRRWIPLSLTSQVCVFNKSSPLSAHPPSSTVTDPSKPRCRYSMCTPRAKRKVVLRWMHLGAYASDVTKGPQWLAPVVYYFSSSALPTVMGTGKNGEEGATGHCPPPRRPLPYPGRCAGYHSFHFWRTSLLLREHYVFPKHTEKFSGLTTQRSTRAER